MLVSFPDYSLQRKGLMVCFMVNWWYHVTLNDISVIYVTVHRCAGGMIAETPHVPLLFRRVDK